MAPETGDQHVFPSVVVQVAEGCSTSGKRSGGAGIGAFESVIAIHREEWQFKIMQRGVDAFHIVQDMALGDKQVFPAIIIEVFQAHAPPGGSTGEDAESGLETAVTERTAAVIVVQAVNFPGQLGHHYVWTTIVVIILKNYTHARHPSPVLGKCSARLQRNLCKRPVSIVVVKILLHAIVGDKYIRKSVAIVIGECYTQSAPFLDCDTTALAHVGEGCIAIVVIQDVGGGGEFFRWTVCMEIAAAIFTMLCVPLHISSNKQI